jgi:radical SAM protein with 4Fe4S-binding SPASM domain
VKDRDIVLRRVAAGEPLGGGYLFWSITAKCPNECGFCGQAALFEGSRELSDRGTIARVIEEAKAEGFRELILTGGEPMIHPDLEAFVAEARQRGVGVSVATSGAGGRRAATRLLACRPGRVALSIDSSDEAVHDQMRRRTGALREVRELLEALAEGGAMDLSIVTVVTRQNIEGLDGLVELARSHGVRHLALSLVLDPWGMSKRDLRPDSRALERYIFETIPRLIELAGASLRIRPNPVPVGASRLLSGPGEALAAYLRSERAAQHIRREVAFWSRGQYNAAFRRLYGCLLPLRDLMILPNGDVYPCSSPTALRPQNRLGNIAKESLAALRRGPALARFYADVQRQRCCAECQALSNSSDGSFLVLRCPELVADRLWTTLRGA